MDNFIVAIVLIIIIGAAAIYMYRAKKKKGIRCIGCPYAGTCTNNASCTGKRNKM